MNTPNKRWNHVGPFDTIIGGWAQHYLTDPFLLSGGDATKSVLQGLQRVELNQFIVMQVSFSPLIPSGDATFTVAHVSGKECLLFIISVFKTHQDKKFRTGNNDSESWKLISTAIFL